MNDTVAPQVEHEIVMYYLGVPVALPPRLDVFRKKFDPKYKFNEAHATLITPFTATVMTQELDQYFADTIAPLKQQEIIASGFHITPQGYVFYTFDVSSSDLLHMLYDRLYQDPRLERCKEREHPFLPHITIGKFESEHAVPQNVIEDLSRLCAAHTLLFDRVRLYGILNEPRKRVHVRDYMCEFISIL